MLSNAHSWEKDIQAEVKKLARHPISYIGKYYDTYNVGGCFAWPMRWPSKRYTFVVRPKCHPIPASKSLHRHLQSRAWEYKKTALEAIHELRNLRTQWLSSQIVAVEQSEKSYPILGGSILSPCFTGRKRNFGSLAGNLGVVDKLSKFRCGVS